MSLLTRTWLVDSEGNRWVFVYVNPNDPQHHIYDPETGKITANGHCSFCDEIATWFEHHYTSSYVCDKHKQTLIESY